MEETSTFAFWRGTSESHRVQCMRSYIYDLRLEGEGSGNTPIRFSGEWEAVKDTYSFLNVFYESRNSVPLVDEPWT